MSTGSSGGSGGGAARSGKGGRTKSGKPRPGTGGYGKKRLEGKGPTPPANMRPGHPAQRQAARERKDYAAADTIRDSLREAGVLIEDTAQGPRWELKR